jgi:hypothetical protein
MQVYKVDPLRDERWVDLIQRSPQASVFHTRGWLETIRQTYGYEPVVFTTSAPTGELQNGLVFCRIRSWLTGSRMVSLPFSDHCEPLFDSAEELNFLVDRLQADMEHQEYTYLEIRPVHARFSRSDQEQGFQPASSYSFHRLDLRPTLGEIFGRLHKDSVQRRIRRAEQAGLVVKCGRSEELLNDFYKLLVLTRGRQHLPPQPYIWFRNSIHYMDDALEIRVAYKETLPIAAVLSLRFRNKTYYKYGCSDAKFHNLGAMPDLLWRTIQEAKVAGSEEFDMGRSDSHNTGLITFKDHWAPEHMRIVYWRYPGSEVPSLSRAYKLRIVNRALACMPNRLLTLTGRFVYRHIG